MVSPCGLPMLCTNRAADLIPATAGMLQCANKHTDTEALLHAAYLLRNTDWYSRFRPRQSNRNTTLTRTTDHFEKEGRDERANFVREKCVGRGQNDRRTFHTRKGADESLAGSATRWRQERMLEPISGRMAHQKSGAVNRSGGSAPRGTS